MKRTTTFTKGSGCYACCICGRATRDDGHGDSVHNRQCSQCFTLAGLENQFMDGDARTSDAREALALIAELESKGARVSAWSELRSTAAHMIEVGP